MRRTLIHGAQVVVGSPERAKAETMDILVDGERIAALGRDIAAPDAEIVDGSGRIVIPGLVNAHMHTWQTALRGMAYNSNLLDYLQRIHGKLAGLYRPDDIYIGNLAGALNQIACGTTTLGDWSHNNPTPEYTDAAVSALHESGIRAVFLHGTPRAAPGSGAGVPLHPRSELERLLKGRFAQSDGLLSLGMAIPGPLYSPAEVAMADFRLAKELDLIVSMHHSSPPPPGTNPWAALEAANLLGTNVNIVHGNHMRDDQLKRLVDRGATFTVTPEVEMTDGHGHPLTGRLIALGDAPSIGIDIESSISGEMLTAARIALVHQRALDHTRAYNESNPYDFRTPICAGEALAWATIHGARALGLERRVGSIEVGKQADLVVIDARLLNLSPVHDPVTAALQASLANIEAVMIAGEWRKRDGRLVYAGLAALQASLAESASRLAAGVPEKNKVGPG